MSGEWIPFTKDLPAKPEVLYISDRTGLPVAEVVLALLQLWSWADDQSADGSISHAPVTLLSRISPHLNDTFVMSLMHVGWITVTAGCVAFANFDRWMGNSSKKRLSSARRKRKSRQNQATASRSGHTDVTPDEDIARTKSVTTTQHNTTQSRGMNSSTTPSCPETPEASSVPAPPALLVFPCDGKEKTWALTQPLVDDLAQAYPSLDVLAEARKALAWVQADPGRKKTAKGMRRFLTGWLARSQDSGRGRRADMPRPEEDDLAARIARLNTPDRKEPRS